MAIGTQTYIKKILIIRAGIVLCFIIAVFLSLSVYERFTIEREMSQRRASLEAEYEALLIRQTHLEKEVEYLSKEGSVEAEIRRHFDVAKEGEKVVIIIDEKGTSTVAPIVPPPPSPPWYIFWR